MPKTEKLAITIKDIMDSGFEPHQLTDQSPYQILEQMPVHLNLHVLTIIYETSELCAQFVDINDLNFNLRHKKSPQSGVELPCNGHTNDDLSIDINFFHRHPGFLDRGIYYQAVGAILPSLIAHELGHVAREKKGFSVPNLMDGIVHEATGIHLQTTIYPDRILPPLDLTSEQLIWLEQEAFKRKDDPWFYRYSDPKEFDSAAYDCVVRNHNRWFAAQFGFPKYAIYGLAHHWLQRYTQATQASPQDLASLPTDQFLKIVLN